VAACGGGAEPPTPLPAEVRPEQPAPVYPASTAFRLETPAATAVLVTPPILDLPLGDGEEATPQAPPLDLSFLQPPPTGLGIARGGAALFAAPNGALLQSLPVGTTVTLTGRSRTAGWLAAYAANGERGWVAAGNFTLFGIESLETVDQPFDPSAVATRIAVDMAPIAMPTIVMTGMFTVTASP
jgi:hypothetical protein